MSTKDLVAWIMAVGLAVFLVVVLSFFAATFITITQFFLTLFAVFGVGSTI